jgi:hypothetical protein
LLAVGVEFELEEFELELEEVELLEAELDEVLGVVAALEPVVDVLLDCVLGW